MQYINTTTVLSPEPKVEISHAWVVQQRELCFTDAVKIQRGEVHSRRTSRNKCFVNALHPELISSLA